LAALYERAASFLRPTETTEPDVWGADNRIYPPSAGVPGKRNPRLTPYMIPFGRAVAAGRHRRVVAVTAAQSGKTDTILDLIGQRLAQRPAPILYAGPTKEFLLDQFEPRLMALFDEAKTLRAKLARGRRNKKTRKVVNGVPIRLAHTGSSTALKSDPAALALVDEYDEMLANVKGQGDPLGLIEARGTTYADFTTAVVSTCSLGVVETEVDPVSGIEFWAVGDPAEIQSPIWLLFQEGTRYHYAWPCPHCGEYFVPMSKHLRYPKRATPAQALRATWMQCPFGCAEPILDDQHKEAMNARGQFLAPGQQISPEGVVSGEPPQSSTWSMWTSGLASPFVKWGQRVEAYLDAVTSGDPAKIQTATNAGYGELFAPGGGEVPEWQEVKRHALPYQRGDVPAEVIRLFAGIDVQKQSIVYVIRGFGSRGTSWLVDYGQLYGPTDEDDVWNDLSDLLMTPVGGMQIEKAFIDSGFRPDKPEAGSEHRVYEFCRRFQWLTFPTKGMSTNPPGATFRFSNLEVKPSGRKAFYTIRLVMVNSDFFKSMVHGKIRTPLGQPGAWYLPEDIEEDYCRQIVSEARVIRAGKAVWVLRGRANHFLDCEALLQLAGYMHNAQRIPDDVARDDPDAPRTLEDIAVPTRRPGAREPPAEPPAPEVADRSLRDRMRDRARGFNPRPR
jgi:phage terminase large subunit GpA-like protein